ncbi:MAG: glycosyltransferase family 4 protein [Saprospiraceae bacterium]|nr:glycosyltransferase family 4 protein [Saprospiraceae bacterium]
MVILVNGRFLIPGKLEGIGLYTFEILQRMTKQNPDVQFIVCIDRPSARQFEFGENVQYELISPPARHPLLFVLWFQFGIARAYRKYRADLFFSPDGFCSLRSPVKRTLLVVHDLAYLHYPDQIGLLMRWYYRFFIPLFLRKADHIITVSQATYQDIIHHFPAVKAKSSVIYNGVRVPEIQPDYPSNPENHLVPDQPYFMTLGSIHPRKNLISVLDAFRIFKDSDAAQTNLVIVGRMAWKTGEIQNRYETHPYKKNIIFTGYLPDHEMMGILKKSKALIYISLFEGFGLPIIEAMAAGVPVLTSNISSMPEIAGDAALLVDPTATKKIAENLQDLIFDESLRLQLIKKGQQRAKLFSWDEASRQIWKLIDSLS